MTQQHYTISYWHEEENGELHVTILNGKSSVYTEDIIGSFEGEDDIKLTCLEIAQSRGYTPAIFENDAVRYGRAGGEKGSANLTPEKRRKRAQNAAKIRWSKKNLPP